MANRLPPWTDEGRQREMYATGAAAEFAMAGFLAESLVGLAIEGSPTYSGSATLLKSKNRLFLATAAHVLRDLVAANALSLPALGATTAHAAEVLFDPVAPSPERPRPIWRRVRLRAIAEACFLDQADTAVVLLNDEAGALLQGMVPITEHHIEPVEPTRSKGANITLAGHPFDISEMGVSEREPRLLFQTHLRLCESGEHANDPAPGALLLRAPDLHLDWSVFLDPRDNAFTDVSSPNGVSGGGVWMCEAGHAWGPDTPRQHARLLGIPWFVLPRANCIRAKDVADLRALLLEAHAVLSRR